jgi:acyl carrier protein
LDLSEDECRTARLRSTSAWDSFAHVELVVEIEERLAIKLTTEQIEGIASYDTLVELLTALA